MYIIRVYIHSVCTHSFVDTVLHAYRPMNGLHIYEKKKPEEGTKTNKLMVENMLICTVTHTQMYIIMFTYTCWNTTMTMTINSIDNTFGSTISLLSRFTRSIFFFFFVTLFLLFPIFSSFFIYILCFSSFCLLFFFKYIFITAPVLNFSARQTTKQVWKNLLKILWFHSVQP